MQRCGSPYRARPHYGSHTSLCSYVRLSVCLCRAEFELRMSCRHWVTNIFTGCGRKK